MEKNTVQLPRHTLMLDGRARAKLTGVTAVSCFNDREVVLETGEARWRCSAKTCTSSS